MLKVEEYRNQSQRGLPKIWLGCGATLYQQTGSWQIYSIDFHASPSFQAHVEVSIYLPDFDQGFFIYPLRCGVLDRANL